MSELRHHYSYREDLNIIERSAITLGDRQPVSCGALYRYREISLRGLPSTSSFGIAQEEVYDAKLHSDAVSPSKKRRIDGRPARTQSHEDEDQPDGCIPFDVDELDGANIVRERWCSILKKVSSSLSRTPS